MKHEHFVILLLALSLTASVFLAYLMLSDDAQAAPLTSAAHVLYA
jgi:hypothetical protein